MDLGSKAPAEVAHQINILIYIQLREMPFRVAMAFILLIALFTFARTEFTYLILASFVVVELLTYVSCIDRTKRRRPVTKRFAYWMMALEVLGSSVYSIPSLFMVQDPGLPTKVMGLVWLFGVTTFVANTHSSMRLFYWLNFAPAGACLLMSGYLLYANAAGPYQTIEWALVGLFFVLFLYNATAILMRQSDTNRALEAARAESHQRLVELELLSNTDPLTGLANRTAFDQKLASLLKSASDDMRSVSVFIIDLDKFKPINDAYGHEVGDKVLKITADRLEEFVAGHGFAARLGGDEFALVYRGIETREDALQIGLNLVAHLAEPTRIGEDSFVIRGSVGISLTDDSIKTATKMCQEADRAMFDAKKSENQPVAVHSAKDYRPSLTAKERRALIMALQKRQIKPYYQPQIDMLTGEVKGLEALARWDHPQFGVLSPAAFIPHLRECGMMQEFTYCITRQVLQDASAWVDYGLDFQVSLNIDETSLSNQNGIDDLLWLIAEHAKAAEMLTMEVTEDVVLARAENFIRQSIQRLMDAGMRISLDDFGTGFASFRHLKEMTFHELKIDTSFVASIGTDQKSKVIIEGFLSIAAGLGIEVVAEGVETEQQRDFLLKRGCNIGQGFLYSKALPVDEITAFCIERSQTAKTA